MPLPYKLIRMGPSEKPCPLHSQLEGLLLENDHPFWGRFEKEKGGHKHCKCWLQDISSWRYEKLLSEGVPSQGKPILGENGLGTGRFEKKTVPAITSV